MTRIRHPAIGAKSCRASEIPHREAAGEDRDRRAAAAGLNDEIHGPGQVTRVDHAHDHSGEPVCP